MKRLMMPASALGPLLLTAVCAQAAPAKPVAAKSLPVPEIVPLAVTSPLGKPLSLKFHDEFDAVKDKDGQPYIDRSKWQTTF